MIKKNKKILIILLIFIILILVYKTLNIPQRIYMYIYPKKYCEYIDKYSEELGIDPLLVYAIVKTESNFKEKIESKSGATGLMQLMEKTAQEQSNKMNIEFNKDMLYNPEINLKLGINYFKTLLDYFNQNYILAFASYNAGVGNVQKWINNGIIDKDGKDIENIPFKETNMYVRKIIRNYEMYKRIYL